MKKISLIAPTAPFLCNSKNKKMFGFSYLLYYLCDNK
jgi:hypothetical protein